MLSMTGFASKELTKEDYCITINIKTLNSRFLDFYSSIPSMLNPHELLFREKITKRLVRGKVDYMIRVSKLKQENSVVLNEHQILNYLEISKQLKELCQYEAPLSFGELIKLPDVLIHQKEADNEELITDCSKLFDEVIDIVLTKREEEGKGLYQELNNLISSLEEAVDKIEAQQEEISLNLAEQLRNKVQEVIGDRINEERVLNEVTLSLIRFDIREEIVRLRIHLSSFREIMKQDNSRPIGKELDFLAQEILREINTIGSKTSVISIQPIIIQMKSKIEQVREQLRNVL